MGRMEKRWKPLVELCGSIPDLLSRSRLARLAALTLLPSQVYFVKLAQHTWGWNVPDTALVLAGATHALEGVGIEFRLRC